MNHDSRCGFLGSFLVLVECYTSAARLPLGRQADAMLRHPSYSACFTSRGYRFPACNTHYRIIDHNQHLSRVGPDGDLHQHFDRNLTVPARATRHVAINISARELRDPIFAYGIFNFRYLMSCICELTY